MGGFSRCEDLQIGPGFFTDAGQQVRGDLYPRAGAQGQGEGGRTCGDAGTASATAE